MTIRKGLMTLLARDNVKISNEELDEVMDIYKNLIKFFMGYGVKKVLAIIKEWFELSYNDLKKDDYYQALLELIELKRKDLLMYLDYAIVYTNVNISDNPDYEDISELREYFQYLLKYHDVYPQTYKGELRGNTYRVINDDLVDCIKKLKRVNYIPPHYIDVLYAYYEVYMNYARKRNSLYYNIDFDDFLEDTYFYFLEKKIIYKEAESILPFIRSLIDSEDEIEEKMNLAGFHKLDFTDDKIIEYIDLLYNNSDIEKINIR